MKPDEYRCKNCRHHYHGDITRVMKCDHPRAVSDDAIIFVSPNGFCAWHEPAKCACHVCESGRARIL